MPGASPTNDLAAGLMPTAEGNAGLTLTHFMVGQRESAVEPDLLAALNPAGLGGLWVELNPRGRQRT
jgi:hypothetical protein